MNTIDILGTENWKARPLAQDGGAGSGESSGIRRKTDTKLLGKDPTFQMLWWSGWGKRRCRNFRFWGINGNMFGGRGVANSSRKLLGILRLVSLVRLETKSKNYSVCTHTHKHIESSSRLSIVSLRSCYLYQNIL